MATVIGDICKIRDILVSDNDRLIAVSHVKYQQLADKIRNAINKKTEEPKYEMDFTAQDLREMADEIIIVLKRWEKFLDAKNQTSWFLTKIKENDGKANVKEYIKIIVPYLRGRFMLVALHSLCIYTATMLYLIEESDNDEFAIKYTERIKRNRFATEAVDSVFGNLS